MEATGYGAIGEAENGLIQVELDGDGRIWDLTVDPRAMALSADEFRVALITAFTRAQDQVHEQVTAAAAAYATETPPPDAIEMADRRFAEISLALHDLTRQAARR